MSYQIPLPDSPQPEGEEPAPQRSRGCLFSVVAATVVVAMLGTAVYGAIYAYRQWRANVEAPSTTVADESTGVVNEMADDDTAVADENTPVLEVVPAADAINRLVIVNEDNQVETMAPDGSERRALTATNAVFQFPAWSPDGSSVAVVGSRRSGSSIYLLTDDDSADPENPLQIYRENNYNPFYLYWSPDGTRISFLASHQRRDMTLNLIPAAADGERQELLEGSPIYWQWTQEGRQLMLHSGFSGDESRLTIFNPNEDLESVDDIASAGFFQAPGISQSGRYLAFAEVIDGENSQIVIADTESGGRQEVRHAGLAAMTWSPTADHLAYLSGSPNSDTFWGDLQLFDAETGDVRMLAQGLVVAFFWSPNGRYLATISAPNGNNDIIADAGDWSTWQNTTVDTNRAGKRPAQRGHNFNFNLSIVDITTGHGVRLAEFEPTFLFLSQFLPFFDQYALSHQLWSPASDALVLPMRENGRAELYVLPIDGSPKQFLAEGSIGFWSHQ